MAIAGCLATPAAAQPERMQIWDLEIGATLDEMPDWIEFRNYACGSDGGPPSLPLAGWEEFDRCRPDPRTGLYEVYFEYDNEVEYIMRAIGDPRIARFVGTTDKSFPIVASALFDDEGVLRGIRVVTDPRANFTNDLLFDLTAIRAREEHYILGPYLGADFQIDPDAHCVNLPLAAGETRVETFMHVKLNCERIDEEDGLRYILQTRYLRKPGQFARDPFTGLLTEGQYESSTRAEIYQIGYGPEGSTIPTPEELEAMAAGANP